MEIRCDHCNNPVVNKFEMRYAKQLQNQVVMEIGAERELARTLKLIRHLITDEELLADLQNALKPSENRCFFCNWSMNRCACDSDYEHAQAERLEY